MITAPRISDVRIDSATARLLIGELNTELAAQYPEEGANHFRLDPDEVEAGRGAFVVASDPDSGRELGCGAVRLIEPRTAELKRMYVRPEARRSGTGAALLTALEDRARALGANRLVLETGPRQHAALRLYEQAGFVVIDAFGEYVDAPLSVCLAKPLAPAALATHRPAGLTARRLSGVPLELSAEGGEPVAVVSCCAATEET